MRNFIIGVMPTLARAARLAFTVAAMLLGACASGPKKEPAAVEAAPPKPNPFQACHRRKKGEQEVLDQASATLQETVCGASLWFDGLFGERDVAAARTAHGSLEISTANSEFEGEETRIRFDARVQLPALERRLSAFIGRDNEEDVSQDRREGLGLRSQADELNQVEDWFAGLGYRLEDRFGVRSEFRVGVRGVRHPVMFMQLRNSYTAYEDDDDRVTLRLTPFVNHLDGAGVTTGADYDHALSKTRLVRWNAIATDTEESPGVLWRTAALLYQSLAGYRAVALEAFERGATGAPESLLEYGVRTIYREPFFERRLFAELVVGYSWPRVDPALDREGSAGFTFGLELPFGKGSTASLAPEKIP
jgi:hypothetical protein